MTSRSREKLPHPSTPGELDRIFQQMHDDGCMGSDTNVEIVIAWGHATDFSAWDTTPAPMIPYAFRYWDSQQPHNNDD